MEVLFKQAALLGDVWVLYVLVACSLLSFAVIYERVLVLGKNHKRSIETATKFMHLFEARDLAGLEQLLHVSDCSVSHLLNQIWENRMEHREVLENILSAMLIQETQRLKKRIGVLGTLGNNAPFIGLFGTVLGVIKAFHDLSIAGETGTFIVMSGISSALVITALGIFVAIPSVIANNYLLSRIKGITAAAESASRIMIASVASTRLNKEKNTN